MTQLQAMVVEWAANCSTRLKVEDAKAVEASDAAAEATRAAKAPAAVRAGGAPRSLSR